MAKYPTRQNTVECAVENEASLWRMLTEDVTLLGVYLSIGCWGCAGSFVVCTRSTTTGNIRPSENDGASLIFGQILCV